MFTPLLCLYPTIKAWVQRELTMRGTSTATTIQLQWGCSSHFPRTQGVDRQKRRINIAVLGKRYRYYVIAVTLHLTNGSVDYLDRSGDINIQPTRNEDHVVTVSYNYGGLIRLSSGEAAYFPHLMTPCVCAAMTIHLCLSSSTTSLYTQSDRECYIPTNIDT